MVARGLSLPRLADQADVDKGNLSRIMRLGTGYSSRSLAKIAKALHVPVAALFVEDSNLEALPPGLRKVPILDGIQAGTITGVEPYRDEDMKEYTFVSAEYSSRAFAMRVKGDSMRPDFSPGELVIVEPEASPTPGQFVVATNGDGEALLRRYAERGKSAEGVNIFELIPSNNVYATPSSEHIELQLLGVAKEKIIKLP